MAQATNDTAAAAAAHGQIPVDPGARHQLTGPVQALVLDIDGTFKDTFDVWYERSFGAVEAYAASRAAARGQTTGEVLEQIRAEIPDVLPYRHFTNIDVLARELPVLQPRDGENFEAVDARIAHDYARHRDTQIRAFPGTAETFAHAQARGALLFINTDAKRADVVHTLYRMNLDPDLFQEIWCKEDDHTDGAAPHPIDDDEARFKARVAAKIRTNKGKPNPEMIDDIADRYRLDKGRMLFVGDNASDAKTALPAGIPLAWQKQGAIVRPETEAWQHHVALKDHYKIGLEATVQKMKDAGAWPPAYTLEAGITDLTRFAYENVRDHAFSHTAADAATPVTAMGRPAIAAPQPALRAALAPR